MSDVSPNAGKPAKSSILVDVSKLVASYYDEQPDPGMVAERVVFGSSGHRGSAFDRVDAPATADQKRVLEKLSAADLHVSQLAGEPIEHIATIGPVTANRLGASR